MTTLIVFQGLCLLTIAANISLSIWATWHTHSWWRLPATFPILAFVLTSANIVIDGRRDPTSHNLWPFELLIISLLGMAFSIAILLWHRLMRHLLHRTR
jgi:hypothetical protein